MDPTILINRGKGIYHKSWKWVVEISGKWKEDKKAILDNTTGRPQKLIKYLWNSNEVPDSTGLEYLQYFPQWYLAVKTKIVSNLSFSRLNFDNIE